jgi:hypothetical protein
MAAELRELREDYAAGRLTLDEFAARVGDALRDDPTRPAHSGPFDAHLVAGEKILWVGRPDPTMRLTKSDFFAVPFSLAWGGFAIFWETSVIASGAPIFFVLWGVPFVAVGLYLIAGRFVQKARVRRRTLYAVTDRRVLKVVRRRSGDNVDALFVDAIPVVNRELRRDGSGSVLFGSTSLQARANALIPVAGPEGVPLVFEDIPDPAYVAELVTDLRRAPRD